MVSEPKTNTIVKQMVLTSNTQANKKSRAVKLLYNTVKAFNAIVTTPCNCLNKKINKKKQQITSHVIITFSL